MNYIQLFNPRTVKMQFLMNFVNTSWPKQCNDNGNKTSGIQAKILS